MGYGLRAAVLRYVKSPAWILHGGRLKLCHLPWSLRLQRSQQQAYLKAPLLDLWVTCAGTWLAVPTAWSRSDARQPGGSARPARPRQARFQPARALQRCRAEPELRWTAKSAWLLPAGALAAQLAALHTSLQAVATGQLALRGEVAALRQGQDALAWGLLPLPGRGALFHAFAGVHAAGPASSGAAAGGGPWTAAGIKILCITVVGLGLAEAGVSRTSSCAVGRSIPAPALTSSCLAFPLLHIIFRLKSKALRTALCTLNSRVQKTGQVLQAQCIPGARMMWRSQTTSWAT